MKRVAPFVVLLVIAIAVPSIAAGAAPDKPSVYWVGIAKRSIDPSANGTFDGQPVYLGGYGFGSGTVGVGPASQQNVYTDGRTATGLLKDAHPETGDPGIFARAMVVAAADDPKQALVLGELDTQGCFVATKVGPYGLEDIRAAASQATGLPEQQIIFDCDHTHAGPDTIGVWGGVPTSYLAYMKAQAVDAVQAAWAGRVASNLFADEIDARDLQSNQFGYDPANSSMDSQLRVLQARAVRGHRVVATMLNLSAHPTVMGGDNRLVSADWPGPTSSMLATRYGGDAITMVGTLGRTQPNDGPSSQACNGDQYCALHGYSLKVFQRAEDAIATATPLTGPASVTGHSYLIADAAHNALLLGLVGAGDPVGAGIIRSMTPPWQTGNLIGTVVFTARIGDLLIEGGPGELYPQIPLTVESIVKPRIMFVIGLAGDQLGYILAPFPDAYPQPIRASMFDNSTSCGPLGCPSP